jgi:hypothetical protein
MDVQAGGYYLAEVALWGFLVGIGLASSVWGSLFRWRNRCLQQLLERAEVERRRERLTLEARAVDLAFACKGMRLAAREARS